MRDTRYAISLHQPYASLLVLGEKKFETRHWPIPQKDCPRPVAVHAAIHFRPEARSLCFHDPHIRAALVRNADRLHEQILSVGSGIAHVCFSIEKKPIYLPFGCLVGTGEFASSVPVEALDVSPKEAAMGNYAPGRHAWPFTNAKLIVPVPMMGRQRWWRISEEFRELT